MIQLNSRNKYSAPWSRVQKTMSFGPLGTLPGLWKISNSSQTYHILSNFTGIFIRKSLEKILIWYKLKLLFYKMKQTLYIIYIVKHFSIKICKIMLFLILYSNFYQSFYQYELFLFLYFLFLYILYSRLDYIFLIIVLCLLKIEDK